MLQSDMYKKFAIIDALTCIDKPGLEDIKKWTDIPIPTIKRQLPVIRESFGMEILFVRKTGVHGKSGYYVISDWGFIDKPEFLKAFAMMQRPS